MALSAWALPRISSLLPLDEDSLKQIIDYTSTLPKEDAAEHLKNLLGDSPAALEFISSFNARREAPKSNNAPPRSSYTGTRKAKKNKAPASKLPPARRPEDYGNTSGGYIKRDESDYIPGSSRARAEPSSNVSNTLALSDKPEALQLPKSSTASSLASSRTGSPSLPPSASGPLISDLPNVRTSTSSTPSRTSSPNPPTSKASSKTTKISLSGGTSMHGASSTINDLDSAIRALEIQTNPALQASSDDRAKRRCTCNATRHPLLAAAPNCLQCGKIVCVKEGIGPCTFCGRPLLRPDDIQAMVRALRDERGREKMLANNASHRKADVAQAPRPFAVPASSDSEPDARLAAATAHRDRLLQYQAQNARRTRVIDQAADFETPVAGQSLWSSPAERALQLKRQQKVLREQEWNARPEWEKRRVVVSVDLVGGKVVKRMGEVERERDADEDDDEDVETGEQNVTGSEARERGKGTFSRNPLMGGLIRPVWNGGGREGKGKEPASDGTADVGRQTSVWRRVQDDNNNNEKWILDGGIYGGRSPPPDAKERILGAEEHAQG